MSDDRVGVPGEIGIAVPMWCEKHEAPFKAKNCNKQATIFAIMGEFMHKRVAPKIPKGATSDDIAAAFASSISQLPMCCQIGDEALAAILKRTPASTGDEHRDEEIALMLHQDAGRERNYPKPGHYTKSSEGGNDYYMHLSEAFKDWSAEQRRKDGRKGDWKGRDMMMILTEGHPKHLRGPDDVVTVLRVGRVSSVKEARKQFSEWLNDKAWLREGELKQ